MSNRVRRALRGARWGAVCVCLAACGEHSAEDPLIAATSPLPPVTIDRGSLAPINFVSLMDRR